MKLSECTIGRLIVKADNICPPDEHPTLRVGHVVGLSINDSRFPEIIPLVRFANKREAPIHHHNLNPFID